MNKMSTRILAIIILVYSSYCYIQVLYKDNAVKQILNEKKANQRNSDIVFNKMVYYPQAEKVAVAIYNQQFLTKTIDIKLIDYYATQLLKANDRSAQALYFKAIVADSSGDTTRAANFAQNAVDYDPNNITYLMGLGVLKIQLGELDQIENILNKIKEIDPIDPKIKVLQDELNNKSRELNVESK